MTARQKELFNTACDSMRAVTTAEQKLKDAQQTFDTASSKAEADRQALLREMASPGTG